MNEEVIFREARKEELNQLLKLYEELYSHFYTDDRAHSKESDVKEIWEEINRTPHFKYFVIVKDGEIIATCTLSVIPNLSYQGKPYGLVEHVVTRKGFHGKGYGTELLKYTLNQAWKQNCYKVMLLTSSTDESSFSFYEKAGFERGIKTGFIAYPST